MDNKDLPGFDVSEREDSPRLLEWGNDATETIDLGNLFTKDLTSSGSFDVKGGIWASTFGKLLQALPFPAFLVDHSHQVIAANQACSKIDPDYEDTHHKPFTDLFPEPTHSEQVGELLEEVFSTRKPRSMQGMLGIGKGQVWGRLTFRSMRIVDVRSILVLVEDLTNERKLLSLSRRYQAELEKRVHQRTVELKESNERLRQEIMERKKAEEMLIQTERLRAMGEMSAGVSHNFKNLLQMLMGLTDSALKLLEAGKLHGARKELENIFQTVEHGAETANRLQDFAKLSSDSSHEHGKVFDLCSLSKQAIEITKPFWETQSIKRGAQVEIRTDLSKGCLVKGNESQIFEVLVNLIKNAAEAVQSKGIVKLTTRCEQDEAIFEIRDTGVGIPKENMRKLFTPFFTTKSEAGTGLGLAASRSIVENHGGSITARSSHGDGTTFTIRFPLAGSPSAQINAEAPATVGGSLTVLAVDDMESTLMTLQSGLETYNHKVLTAVTGEEALMIFQAMKVDVVLCDLAMPGMNGWEVCKRLNEICIEQDRQKPLIILFTAWANQRAEKQKMSASGVDTIVQKPVDIPQLAEIISTAYKQMRLQ